MTDRLRVQRDDVGLVVRVTDGETTHEVDPQQAIDLGEALIRAGRDLQTTQSTLPAEGTDEAQSTLDEQDDDGRRPLSALLEEGNDRARLEALLDPNDPMEW